MHVSPLLEIIWIGLASNLDNGGVGVAYGVRRVRIPWLPNLVIAIISFAGTLIAGLFGNVITHWVPSFIDNLVGAIVIICVGVGVLLQPFFARKPHPQSRSKIVRIIRSPEEADFNKNNHISFTESIILGIALSMNALAGGFDAGITKLSILYTSFFVGIFSFLLLWVGTLIGKKFAANRLGDHATIVAGVLLILIGIEQFF
ncbi:sporulation membrane protein YtaF [Alicyclobacillus fastidiosus]|uniref:Sporulation membrane protein YtaF n=1 Tax=Alicyclobacillus fastidiosus TaxID=392011 RepID=A0ABY6ZGK3_9BACL|nr:sporulation membrane protein YtaF [Alicyclobacillus fastidiosus]WAH41255.1 sporulation membrane protein YtaF [Alicyclobacillus fastidiosus]GMA62850.1 sporulation membrane protein YtaF [Alicyclobacillus fastidiosus]